MTKARLVYELNIEYQNLFTPYQGSGGNSRRDFLSSSNVFVQSNKLKKSNDVSRSSWDCNMQDESVGGFDFEAMLNTLSPDDYQTELTRLQELFQKFNDGDLDTFYTLVTAVEDYVTGSVLFDTPDRLINFFQKFGETQIVMQTLNTSDAQTQGEMNKALDQAKKSLKKIWGNNLKFTDTSSKSLADEFDGFIQLIREFDEKTPPLSFQTMINYNLDVKKREIPFNAQRALTNMFALTDLLSDAVAYKDLPARLFKIQEKLLGSLPESLPEFQICLDHLGCKDTSYRISFEANSVQDLVSGLKQKHDEFLENQGYVPDSDEDQATAFQITVRSYKDQSGFFSQSYPATNLESLLAQTLENVRLPGQNAVENRHAKPHSG